ncbi:hypothetical protein KUH03_19355 [Sphingobacterium sp. E70]|uniref:hypothetical protein n=1 Tax=Sphingobacterium sp. E70 TaxID=2853439 RepID=UPI00211B94F6|nr:hypothetical protein [Sphingobacterium sp. E70]ULT28494.1 hypothetical protein KUH03_19355 [Sphingobacterium sp. E70]
MTAQTPEEFIYKGKRYQSLYAEPLDQYLQKQNFEFQPIASSCWRGYSGLWVISDNKLFLTHFSGAIRIYQTEKMNSVLTDLTKSKILALIIYFQISRMFLLNGFQGR